VHLELKNSLFKAPDFFGIMTPRGGKTIIYPILSLFPQIFIPKIKEPLYFCVAEKAKLVLSVESAEIVSYFVQDVKDYFSLFQDAPEGSLREEALT